MPRKILAHAHADAAGSRAYAWVAGSRAYAWFGGVAYPYVGDAND